MSLKNLVLLFGVGLIWGSQFIFQGYAVSSIAPIWVGASRTVIGFLTLLILCRLMGLKTVQKKTGLYAVIGLLEAAIPFALIPWGQQFVDSSIAAILMGTVPFFAVLLAPIFIAGAAIRIASLASVALGFSGLLVLFYPQLSQGMASVNLSGVAAILIAAASFAIALLLLKRVETEHPLIVARNVLGMASLQIVGFALVVAPLDAVPLSADLIGALLYLGIMCAGVVYFLYMTLIRDAGAVFASMTNYLVPAIGVVIGAVFNAETISLFAWLALAIILASIAINQLSDLKRPLEPPAKSSV